MCSRFRNSEHLNCMFTHYPKQEISRHALMLDNSLKITGDSAGLVESDYRRGFPAMHSFVGSCHGSNWSRWNHFALCRSPYWCFINNVLREMFEARCRKKRKFNGRTWFLVLTWTFYWSVSWAGCADFVADHLCFSRAKPLSPCFCFVSLIIHTCARATQIAGRKRVDLVLQIAFSKFSNQHSISAPVCLRSSQVRIIWSFANEAMAINRAGAEVDRYGYFSGGRSLKASN